MFAIAGCSMMLMSLAGSGAAKGLRRDLPPARLPFQRILQWL